MTIEHRLINEDEFTEWRIHVRRAFNEQVHPDDIARLRNDRGELDRLFGAFEDGKVVGTGGIDSHSMTVPGGASVPTAGIAYVSTAATHRRRGVLTGTMTKLLQQVQERAEPLAALWASESVIYSRFGYGQATTVEDWEIDPAKSRFAFMPEASGKLRYIDHAEAFQLMPGVWDEVRKQRAGMLDRSERRWRYNFFDEERVRGGWSGLFFVVYEDSGECEGYAAYRLRHIDEDDDDMQMKVVECVASTNAAHAALWRLLFDVDLVRSVAASKRPPDDPVWWMLADPRRLERTPIDGIWVRVVDPEKALSARTYSAEDRLVIEVQDSFLPDAAGTFELDAGFNGAVCRRTSRPPDISITASQLGSAYLGDSKLRDMAATGSLKEHTTGAVRRFDRLFTADQSPWCPHDF